MYSLGTILWEMVTRDKPWHTTRHAVIAFQVAIEKARPPLPEVGPMCPMGLRSLIDKCWRHTPSERPACWEVYKALGRMLEEASAGAKQRAATPRAAGSGLVHQPATAPATAPAVRLGPLPLAAARDPPSPAAAGAGSAEAGSATASTTLSTCTASGAMASASGAASSNSASASATLTGSVHVPSHSPGGDGPSTSSN